MIGDRPLHSAVVLGAGTMGAQIAAHFANAGLPTVLLDLTAGVAREGLKRAQSLKPDPFFRRGAASLVTTGGFDTDWAHVSQADWVVEAVVERLDIKRNLMARVDETRRQGSIVSSNTSGIPIASIADGRSEDFRRHWLGTHFFNPPRYLHLVEIIPTADTDPDVLGRISRFADRRLGKGVVVAKDTPNFIANHIGLFAVARILRMLESGEYTIEEIDAMTGPALGRPKSATFRTMDIAGVDVLGHVAANLAERLPDETARRSFVLPALVGELIARGWIGEKAGQGFYKRIASSGGSEILTLDARSMEYRPKQPARLASLDSARSIEDVGERIRTLFSGADRVGDFLRRTLAPTLMYVARVTPDIAHSIDDVDRAMQWGFGWELGPFELWDAIGVDAVTAACGNADIPPLVAELHRRGRQTFRDGQVPPAGPGLQILRAARDGHRVVKSNPGASLLDIGDGVLAVEFHSKMNAIGGDTLQMLHAGVAEATKGFAALVVGNEATHFSAGANLTLLLLEAQEGNWDEIDMMVRAFQGATMALRYADVPVVVAPAGMAIGGGCEIVLHGDRVQAAAESYIGLVEVGVGLIPAGGGTKEMLARAMEAAPSSDGDVLPFVQRAFETIGFAKVSTSGPDAKALGYLGAGDAISMNRDRVLADAKAVALEMARRGYARPAPRRLRVGGSSVEAALSLGVHLAWRAGRISEHDATIGRTLAHILAGGSLPHSAVVSEQHLLDLEREAFLKLCGERKTLERIQHTLKTGKTLRN